MRLSQFLLLVTLTCIACNNIVASSKGLIQVKTLDAYSQRELTDRTRRKLRGGVENDGVAAGEERSARFNGVFEGQGNKVAEVVESLETKRIDMKKILDTSNEMGRIEKMKRITKSKLAAIWAWILEKLHISKKLKKSSSESNQKPGKVVSTTTAADKNAQATTTSTTESQKGEKVTKGKESNANPPKTTVISPNEKKVETVNAENNRINVEHPATEAEKNVDGLSTAGGGPENVVLGKDNDLSAGKRLINGAKRSKEVLLSAAKTVGNVVEKTSKFFVNSAKKVTTSKTEKDPKQLKLPIDRQAINTDTNKAGELDARSIHTANGEDLNIETSTTNR